MLSPFDSRHELVIDRLSQRVCFSRWGGAGGVLPSLPGHGAQPVGWKPGFRSVWRHATRDVHHSCLHWIYHWQGHPQHHPAGKQSFQSFIQDDKFPNIWHDLTRTPSLSSAAAPGERRGVPAGGRPVPGWEEEGSCRGKPVLTVCQSSLGNQLSVESRESHGWGELLQGTQKV